MVTMIMIVTYTWNIFIKHYSVHILAKFWASIAYMKCISTLQIFGLKIKANFNKSSAIF